MKTGLLIATIVTGAASLQAQTSLAQRSSPSLDPTIKVYPAPTLSNSPPKADPVMTEELMARLIKRTLASKKDFAIPAATCSVFNLCEAGHDLPARQISAPVPEGKHLIMVPLKEGSKDVVIAFVVPVRNRGEIYLTDGSGKLRAAAIGEPGGVRLITNEAAAEQFKAEMALLAKEAAEFPPADSAVRGNK